MIFALPLTLCAPLLAQDARVLGKVVARDGSPIEAAEVVLRSHGWLYHPEFGEHHEVRVKTGKTGRFRAKIFAHRSYSAWARLPGDAPRFTEVREGFAPGERLLLRAEGFARKPQRVVFRGIDAWKSSGPFRARCLSMMQNFVQHELTLENDGESVRVPALPGRYTVIELIDARGELLMYSKYSNAYKARAKSKSAEGGESKPQEVEHITKLKVRAPRRVRIRLHAFEDKKTPIVGARVLWSLGHTHSKSGSLQSNTNRSVMREIGVTDEAGKIDTLVPLPAGKTWGGHFAVHPAGYILTSIDLQTHGSNSFTTVNETKDDSIDLVCRLKRGPSISGRVLDAEGKPVADLSVLCPQPCAMWFANGGASWRTLAPRAIKTDADGRFRLGALMPNRTINLIAKPTAAQRARMAPNIDGKSRVASSVVLATFETKTGPKPIELGDLRAEMRILPVEIQLRGSPVPGARVVALFKKHESNTASIDDVICDRRGRASLLISTKIGQLVAWHPRFGYVIQEVDRSRLTDDQAKMTLELQAFRVASGRVVDSQGQGLQGATLQSWGSSTRGSVRRIALTINEILRNREKSGADGKFRIPFIPEPNHSINLRANYMHKGRHMSSANQVDVRFTNTDVEDLELKIQAVRSKTKKK